jgi:tetratricopeptide (TPR) repeat protein
VGKSALAVHWAHGVKERFPDGNLFVDMQGYGPGAAVDPGSVLEGFLRAFGLPPEQIPVEMHQRASLFRSVVNGKRLLIVLDNASSTGQVRHLLPATTQSFVLITSRSKLAGLGAREAATRMNVDVLSSEESLELLSELLGAERVTRERPAATLLVELCGHLPLALRVLADRARDRPERSLQELADELAGESRSRLDALEVVEDELSDTRAVFSWSYRQLPDSLRNTFRALGIFPGSTFEVRTVAVLVDADEVTIRRRLRALVDLHLVVERTPERFMLHDLLRAYARERALIEDSQISRTEALRKLQSWYLAALDAARQRVLPYAPSVTLMPGGVDHDVSFDSPGDAMRWFVVERANVMATLEEAQAVGHYDFCWKLPVVVSGLLELGWYLPEWQHVHEVGRRAATAIGDRLGQAANELLLGDAMWRQGDPERAAELYKRAAALAEGAAQGWIAAFATRGLGLLREERGDSEAARSYFRRSLAIFRRIGHRRGEAMTLLSLAAGAGAEGDANAGVVMGLQAVDMLNALGDEWSVAWGRVSVAENLVVAGRHDEALEQLRLSAVAFREIGDPQGEVLALVPLAAASEQRRDLVAACEALARAADLCDEIGDQRAEEMRRRAESLAERDA